MRHSERDSDTQGGGEVHGSGRYRQGAPGCKGNFGVDPDVIVIYACNGPRCRRAASVRSALAWS